MTNPLIKLHQLGQSVWLDNLSRDLLRSGELKKLIGEDHVSGITSNPTILEKAIRSQKSYDSDVHVLVDKGLKIQEIYEAIVIADVREAADILRQTYDDSKGDDGYVSLEVSPSLAYDKAATVDEARRLFAAIDRPNVMIKVPGTRPGMEAVSDLIASGVNINVTLIFSLEQTMAAAQSYAEGLHKWVLAGGDASRPASVASIFVSRIDTVIDQLLKDISDHNAHVESKELRGRTAIANSQIAYAMHSEFFKNAFFTALKAKGARPQRIVWASTSTKNPAYSDIYYVENLVGHNTVNTIPPATLNAYRDHGNPCIVLGQDTGPAREHLARLENLGLDVVAIMDRLLADGLKAFADSYDSLLNEISGKRIRLIRGWGHRSASLGALQKRVDLTLERLDSEKFSEQIWNGDTSLWSDDPAASKEISQRLGWLNIVDTVINETSKLKEFASEVAADEFSSAVLLGMGGSSLAAEVFDNCLGSQQGFLKVHVLDTTVPDTVSRLEKTLDPHSTLFIVASKSGGTIEVLSLYKYFRKKMEGVLGDDAGRHFIAITDPGTSLGKLAADHGFRRTFLNPPDIGGRFSALSYFGLVPAALVGANLDLMLMRASQAVEASGASVRALQSPGTWLGAIMAEAALAGRDKLTLIISPNIASFGYWLEQLIAESTGKMGKGIIPVNGEPVAPPEAYGTDRLFVYLRLDADPDYDEAVSSLEKAGHPVVTLRLHGPCDIGREMFRWEYATAVAGAILRVNPFDQPNVQESKDVTKKILEQYKKDLRLPDYEYIAPNDPNLADRLGNFLAQAKEGGYVGINAFIDPTSENISRLQTMRQIIRDHYKLATCLGFGPRYLHSTGQLHKGGPKKGLFLIITSDDRNDLMVPGESYSLAVLKTAQALGDFMALMNKGLPVIRIHVKSESQLEICARACGGLP